MKPKQEQVKKKDSEHMENEMQNLKKFIKQKERQNKVLKKLLENYKPSKNK